MSGSRVSDATGRIMQRRRFTRRQRLLGLAVGLVAAVTFGALGWLVGLSDVLAVRRVDVQGAKVLSADEVRSVAAVQNGQPLLWVDPAAIATRVSGLAPVAQVSVVRGWPNAVLIRVTERRPLFALESGTGFLVVDGSGVIFQSVLERPAGLVVADAPAGDARLLGDLATVLASLDPDLRSRVRRIGATSPDTIDFTLDNGVEVFWGSADQSPVKQQVLSELMKLRQARHYDVSAPSNPTTR